MKLIGQIFGVLLALIVFIGIIYGIWLVKRNFNYAFEYEAKVIETVETKYEKRITDLETQIKALQEK